MTIAQAFNEIAIAQGGTASKSGTIAGAIDAVNDALAGSDQEAAQTIEDAVRLLGTHIGGGSSVTVESLTATENKTYTAPEGKAYSPVTVNVSGGGDTYGCYLVGVEIVGQDAVLDKKFGDIKAHFSDANTTFVILVEPTIPRLYYIGSIGEETIASYNAETGDGLNFHAASDDDYPTSAS